MITYSGCGRKHAMKKTYPDFEFLDKLVIAFAVILIVGLLTGAIFGQ